MQSILITGQIEKTKAAALNLCKENEISQFDIQIVETEKTVGIGTSAIYRKNFLKTRTKRTESSDLGSFLWHDH